jgi:TolA-binding protein
MDARNAYRSRVPPPLDSPEALREVVQTDSEHPENNPPFRSKFDFLNARTLYRYGHITEAETEYRRILREHCQDALVAGAAFADLQNMLVAQNRQDDLEALAREQSEQRCRVGDDRVTPILTDARFRHAMDVYQQAERAPADQARALYERAAREMEEAVQSNRSHPQAALATFYVALCYERTGRFDTATQTYIRITQDFNNTRASGGAELTGDALAQRLNILEQSNYGAGRNLERIFDFDNAIRYYTTVATDARFANAQDHGAHVHDALLSVAQITTNLNRWDRAQQAWRDFIPRTANPRERAEAEFRLAEIPYRASNWSEAIRSLQGYLRQNAASGDNAQYRVQAQYQIALAYRRLNDDTNYRRSLREVVNVFRQSGQQPGSVAAARAAEALYRDLDDQVTAFSRSAFTRGDAVALRAQIDRFNAQLREIDNAAREVVALRGGEYSIGALTRQGEAHEHLATQESRIGDLIVTSRADETRFNNVRAQIARLRALADRIERQNPDAAQRLRDQAQQIEDQLQTAQDEARAGVQRTFDQESEAQRKLAIINYATAVHTARSQNIPTAFAARALERLRTEENQPLMQDALTHQNVFQYQPGMFDAEAPGVNVSETRLVATPPVVPEAQAP